MARTSLSKKLRFEVFKRDKFTCQYCGASAPEAVLHVDHIQPFSKAGTDDLLNLITACQECNSGKGARELSDDAVIQKRKGQLDELQERREQLEMMLEWQKSLINLDEIAVTKLAEIWSELVTGYALNELGLANLRKIIGRFGPEQVITAMRASVTSYLKIEDGKPTPESVEKAWEYVARIAGANQRAEDRPYMHDLYYIRGMVRNRFARCNQHWALDLLVEAYEAGCDVGWLKTWARDAWSWSEWVTGMEDAIRRMQEA